MADSKETKQARTLSDKMRRGELFSCDCPSRQVLKHVTSLWGVLVLIALREGTHRFSALRRKVAGVSEKMLAQTLQALEADGFVNRRSRPVVPPHVEYSLTPLGEDVARHVQALADWIETHLPSVLKSGRQRRSRLGTRETERLGRRSPHPTR